MQFLRSKVYPVDENQQEERQDDRDDGDEEQSVEMFVMLLSILFRTTAGMRHPILPSFETLKEDGALTEYEYVPPTSTIIYVSHEWTGNDHSDPRGDQMYHMYLMKLSTMIKMFGSPSDRKKNLQICHQDLLNTDVLTRFEDLPLGSFVMFVSHQWNGFQHPDPHGLQLEVLCNVLRDLRDGVYAVNTDPYVIIVLSTLI